MPRLTIIGLGLIGGSLGLALKRAHLADLEIVGCDAEWEVGRRARKLGAIDRDEGDTAAAVEGAAVIVIATPISAIRGVLEEIAPALAEAAVVTDTASTKRDVLRWAEELLPEHGGFVGGHPIAGKESSGLDAADADLFQGRPWALTPSVHASERAIKTVENLIALVGAHPVLIDAGEHDSYLAALSHLPLVASTALFSLASTSQAWPELAALAGPGFRDLTRLASTSPELSVDICLSNREHLLHWLDRFVDELRRFRELVEAAPERAEELRRAFEAVQAAREAFLSAPPGRPGAAPEVDRVSAGERMLSFMVGEYVLRRTREMEQIMERRAESERTREER